MRLGLQVLGKPQTRVTGVPYDPLVVTAKQAAEPCGIPI